MNKKSLNLTECSIYFCLGVKWNGHFPKMTIILKNDDEVFSYFIKYDWEILSFISESLIANYDHGTCYKNKTRHQIFQWWKWTWEKTYSLRFITEAVALSHSHEYPAPVNINRVANWSYFLFLWNLKSQVWDLGGSGYGTRNTSPLQSKQWLTFPYP